MHNKKILIIDDSRTIREGLKNQLIHIGIPVTNIHTTDNGKQGIEETNLKHYDIVFVDYEMPEMNGEEFTELIRKKETGSEEKTKIVLITSVAERKDIINMLRKGINNYIIKPIEETKVKEKLIYTLGLEDKYITPKTDDSENK